MWITNGALNDSELGDTFLIYARTGNSGKAKQDFSSFLVEKGFEGFSLGQRIKDKCGMRASNTAELVFENCKVPVENLVGSEGSAVLCMMRNLEIERVTLAAMSLGIARRSLEVMSNYAKERVAFGSPLNSFGQIQKNIAESYAEYMAGRTYVYNTARCVLVCLLALLPIAMRGADHEFGCYTVNMQAAEAGQRRQPRGHGRRQAVLRRHGQARGGPRDPDAGRLRIRGRVQRGAAVARLEAAGDRRRHQRVAPQEHGARSCPHAVSSLHGCLPGRLAALKDRPIAGRDPFSIEPHHRANDQKTRKDRDHHSTCLITAQRSLYKSATSLYSVLTWRRASGRPHYGGLYVLLHPSVLRHPPTPM